jgi:hypothetical protein
VTYKNLSLEDLKSLYSERHGFVFIGSAPSSKESCEKLSKQIREAGLCEYEPDFVNELNPLTYAFVYPEGVSFHSSDFYEFSKHASMMVMGMFKIDALAAFLKNN